MNSPYFKPVEFDTFRKQAGLNSFNLTPKKWIEATNAIGLISRSGRYGGTYAHKDFMKALKKVSDDIYIENKNKQGNNNMLNDKKYNHQNIFI